MPALRDIADGLGAPMRVAEQARGTPAARRYARLVILQLAAVVATMSVVTPSVLGGLDAARRSTNVKVSFDKGQLRISKEQRREDPPRKRKQKHRDGDDDGDGDDGDREEDDDPGAIAGFLGRHAPSLLSLWMGLVAVWGAWITVEWLVGAVSYEYVDDISDDMARSLGLPVKPSRRDRPPKLRIDLRWMLRRLRRQIASAIVLASGAPLFLLARMVPRVGHALANAIIAAWGLYWLLVSTAGKSDLGWDDPSPRPPWFLRAWTALTEHVPGFRWSLPRAYGRLWARVTRKMYGAGALFEESPWSCVGLSIVRIVGNVPLLALFVRPVLPVAASLVFVRRRAEAKMGPARAA